jgi:hypothetical protein
MSAVDPVSVAQAVVIIAKEVLTSARHDAAVSNAIAQNEYNIAIAKHETASKFNSTKYADNVAECKHKLDKVIQDNENKISALIIDVTSANKSLGLVLQAHIMGTEIQMNSTAANATMQLNLTEANHRVSLTELINKHQNEITTLQSQQRHQITDIKTHSAKSVSEIEIKLSGLKTKFAELNL